MLQTNRGDFILPIQIAVDVKEHLSELVRSHAYVTDPSFNGDGAQIKLVSKMLRALTSYPTGGVPESWTVHVHPAWGKHDVYEVDSVFYGDERLTHALAMNGIRFTCDNDWIVTREGSRELADYRQGKVPYNLTVAHGSVYVPRAGDSIARIRNSIRLEWDAVQQAYSPKMLTELDLRQAEFTHRLIQRLHQIGNPTLGLGELYIVDTQTFKQRLHVLGTFGDEVKAVALQILNEFEEVEAELKRPSLS